MRAALWFPVALLAGCANCPDPLLGLDLLASAPEEEGKGQLPEGRYEVTVATERRSDRCSFTLTPTGCPGGDPNCVVESTCADTVSYNMDFGELVPVFDVGMSFPALEISKRDLDVEITVTLDGAQRVKETFPLGWVRLRNDPGPYEPDLPSGSCDHLSTPPYVVVGD